MALTKATLIDLNANELILDLDADTSITADSDDTIHIKIGGSDEITITGTALSPSTSDGNALGTSALEWSDLFLADGAVINFGDDQDVSLTHVADTGLLLSSTDQLQFGDSGTYIHQSADGVLDLVSDTEIEINATTIDMNGALDVSGTITSGGVITGTAFTAGSAVITEAELETLDGVTVGTAIASKVVTTDANIDTTGQRNLTISGELDAATGDFSGDVDIDGTANLDTVDIDGATQIDATVTVGVDDTGYDVKFFGATSGAYMLWDESVDDLILAGASRVVVPEGNLVLGSTAVTSTAAELNLLDGVSGLVQADLTKLAAIDATATELNLIDGGATVGTTAVADGDGLLHNDNGTMRVTSAATFKTYFQQGLSSAADDLDAGDAAVLITTSSGNITIDAAANDSDIILKGTDGGADTTFLTIDGSAAGEATFNAGIVIADAGNIGSASDKDAIAIASDGVVTMNQIPVLSAGLNVSGGTIAGTIATATQNSITTATGLTTVGAGGTASAVAGIPFYSLSNSIYTHDVSGTDDTASYNTAYGLNALDAITTGDGNTVMGYQAATALNTGQRNVIIGYQAGDEMTSGGDSVIVGYGAGHSQTTALENTFLGYYAGAEVTDGAYNTFVGSSAGQAATTPADNTAVGARAMSATTTGSDNTALGKSAMAANTTGSRNLAIGVEAYDASDTENDNVAIGFQAMTTNTAGGEENIALGNYALDALTSGDANVAVGHTALGANTTGYSNVGVGHNSLQACTTGHNNTAVGKDALYTATTGNGRNVAVGVNSGRLITSGYQNTMLGAYSGDSITTGYMNVAVGTDSLAAVTTGYENVAIGHDSLKVNTANQNTTVGSYAGTSTTSGASNTFIGASAGRANTTAANNTAVGRNALLVSTTAASNVAIGSNAMAALTTADENVAIGTSALATNQTAIRNVAVGHEALNASTTGYNNTCVGYTAGKAITEGYQNTFIGDRCGKAITTADNNTAVGQNALKASVTDGNNVAVGMDCLTLVDGGAQTTAIGAFAGDTTTTGNYNIMIGFQARASSATASNQITLGNTTNDNLRCNDTSISSLSDQRDKTNIVDLPLGIDFLNTVRPVSFDWNRRDGSMDGKKDFGFVAQELKTAANATDYADHMRLVHDDNPDKLEADPMKMFPILVKAVQELSAKNTALEARVKALEDA